jgi:hypothetical protein
MIGLIGGMALLAYSTEPYFMFYVFIGLGAVQLLMTVLYVHYSDFESLNLSRLRLLCWTYERTRVVMDYKQTHENELWIGEYNNFSIERRLPKIKMAKSMKMVLSDPQIATALHLLQVSFN